MATIRLSEMTDTRLDMSTNAAQILAINGAFAGFAVVVVLLRVYVRAVMLKTMGIDDYLMMGATICAGGLFVCFVGETKHGIGMHTASIPYSEFTQMLHWQYFSSIIVTVGISLIKISVAFFLLRLVPKKAYKIFLYCMIAFLTAFTFTSAGTIAFSCLPIRASWDPFGEPNAKCFNKHTFTAIGIFNSSINIFTDILFASLPIPVVWNLQVNMRTKISLILILSLGYFACAASIIKTVLQTTVLSNPDSTRNDAYFVWNAIELYIGILAASLPSLRPLFKSILDSTKELRTRMTGASSGNLDGQALGVRHKYYMQEDAIGMDSLNAKKGREQKYDVQVTTKSEDEEFSSGSRSGDEIAMDPHLGGVGVTKTVQVSISKSGTNRNLVGDL